jgi:hypothetical protein
LEEYLSRPGDADAAALSSLESDLLILGAGGKMGPSLAKLRARASLRSANEEINRVYRLYPHLPDDDFVKEHLNEWLS